MRRLNVIIAAILLFVVSGCGTIYNVTGHEPWLVGLPPERPIDLFGGLDNDLRWMARGTAPNSSAPLAVVAAAIDMPFSLVGDVVTLPWTAYQSLIVRRASAEPNSLP